MIRKLLTDARDYLRWGSFAPLYRAERPHILKPLWRCPACHRPHHRCPASWMCAFFYLLALGILAAYLLQR